MSIPKPQHPIFELTIPSTKQKVQFRAFTVREEKTLILAQEAKDVATIARAIKSVLVDCVPGLDVDSLTTFDMEYVMTQVRAKSVGEIVILNMPCAADPSHERTPVRIDLSSIEVTFPDGHDKHIPLFEGGGVMMRYPTFDMLEKMDGIDEIAAAAMCIDYYYNGDEIYDHNDNTVEDFAELLGALTQTQLDLIKSKFFATMPVFKHEFSYKCVQCGHEHHKFIKGLSNFFI